jgi:kynureninase
MTPHRPGATCQTPVVQPIGSHSARARALDDADPLAEFRSRFVIDDPDLVYLDGNSLGRLPRATVARLDRLVRDEWGGSLVRGWDDWIDAPARVGELIGSRLLGAQPDETIVGDSTTVNLYKLALAALEARPNRSTVIVPRDEFPTDRYVLERLSATRGLEIRWLDSDPVEGLTSDDLAAVLDDDVGLVLLSLVNYRSAALLDPAAITALAHAAGALILWDLSHAAGSVPVDLEAAGADLAVGCTYKYLNGGPGAPAFLYVRRSRQSELRNPIGGWFGQRDQFAMGPRYDPQPGIRGWLAGTPPIPALAAVEEGVRLTAEAGIAAIRTKGVALTEFAIELLDERLAPLGCTLGSPRDPARRGAHVAIRHPAARELTTALIERGVVPDFREPDSIRFGLPPLTTSFADVATGVERLGELLD